MAVDLNDLISRKRIRFELGESTMPKRYRDFCLRVIDDENQTQYVSRGGSGMIYYTYSPLQGTYYYVVNI